MRPAAPPNPNGGRAFTGGGPRTAVRSNPGGEMARVVTAPQDTQAAIPPLPVAP